jgi:hypothetical protein
MNYYHVTPIDHAEAIRKDGLRTNDYGDLYLLNDIMAINAVAVNQIGLFDGYALFEVLGEAVTAYRKDEVGEYTTECQIIVSHPIKPEFIKWMGNFRPNLFSQRLRENIRHLTICGIDEKEAFEKSLEQLLKTMITRTKEDYEKSKPYTFDNYKGKPTFIKIS